MIPLHLLACLSTAPAARGDLVAVAVEEARGYDTSEARRAVRETYPWVEAVAVDDDAPWVLLVQLGPAAPPDALDIVAEDYSLRVDLEAPVEAWGYSCAEWITIRPGTWAAVDTGDTGDPLRGVPPAREVCKDARWVVSGRSGKF